MLDIKKNKHLVKEFKTVIFDPKSHLLGNLH